MITAAAIHFACKWLACDQPAQQHRHNRIHVRISRRARWCDVVQQPTVSSETNKRSKHEQDKRTRQWKSTKH